MVQADEGYFLPLSSGNYPGATDLVSADFNGDGHDDLVMLFGLQDNFPVAAPQFYLQTNSGLLLPLQEGPPVLGGRVMAADFNNDLNMDILIAGGVLSEGLVFPGSTAVYYNSGDWGQGNNEYSGFDFSSPLNLGGLHYAPEVDVGDLDADGDIDFVLGVNGANGFGVVEIWLNQGFDQGGVLGTFQKTDYIEDTGPYGAITALTLAQISTINNDLDLVFARQGNNQINIALNDGSGSFVTAIDEIQVLGAVKDIQMVTEDYSSNVNEDYIVAALHNAASPIYKVARIGGVPEYELFRTLGTAVQLSEKIIPMMLGTQPGFFLSSDFDGNTDVGVTSLVFYGFTLAGATPQLDPIDQCLLGTVGPAVSAVTYLGNRPIGPEFTDLSLLTEVGEWYTLFNNQSPGSSICCISETQFIAVNEVNTPESHFKHAAAERAADVAQVAIWLDSFQKLRDIRRIIMPLTTDSQRYEANYAQHEIQLIALMATDNGLATAWTNVLSSWNQPLTALLEGSDGQAILTGQQMGDLAAFLSLLQNEPGVGVTVTNELSQIEPLNSYVGGNLQDFTLDTLNLVSPVIFKNTFE